MADVVVVVGGGGGGSAAVAREGVRGRAETARRTRRGDDATNVRAASQSLKSKSATHETD